MRIGLSLVAVTAVLAFASQVRAQVPRGGNGMTFVPINTNNLSTPLPYSNIPQLKKTSLQRFQEAVAKLSPFAGKTRRDKLSAPSAPTTQLPKVAQSQLPPPQAPILKFPTLPSLSTLVTGSIK